VEELFKIIADFWILIVAVTACRYFLYITIKLLIEGILSSVRFIANIITELNSQTRR